MYLSQLISMFPINDKLFKGFLILVIFSLIILMFVSAIRNLTTRYLNNFNEINKCILIFQNKCPLNLTEEFKSDTTLVS